MSWYNKETQTPFEHQPIEGLFFLHGDVVAKAMDRDWTEGMKYPGIIFPSGAVQEIWTAKPEVGGILVHLFGEMDLPLYSDRDTAYEHAKDIASQVGYVAHKRGENEIELVGHDVGEHLKVQFDNEAKRMVDVVLYDWFQEMTSPRPVFLDEESRAKLPPLRSGEQLGLDAVAPVKFFTPDANWTWYASEFDGEDLFFGLVIGYEIEFGYFSLSELEETRGPFNLPIERDRFYEPKTLQELKIYHENERRSLG
jgi:hypothetical protein